MSERLQQPNVGTNVKDMLLCKRRDENGECHHHTLSPTTADRAASCGATRGPDNGE